MGDASIRSQASSMTLAGLILCVGAELDGPLFSKWSETVALSVGTKGSSAIRLSKACSESAKESFLTKRNVETLTAQAACDGETQGREALLSIHVRLAVTHREKKQQDGLHDDQGTSMNLIRCSAWLTGLRVSLFHVSKTCL